MSKATAERIMRESVIRLSVAVGRCGRLEPPPPHRIVIAANPECHKRVGELPEDHLMVVNQSSVDAVLGELDRKRAAPGKASFCFTELSYGLPWYDIQAEIYSDLVVLQVKCIHSLEKPAAPAA